MCNSLHGCKSVISNSLIMNKARKFKEGISCCGHLAARFGGKLLYLDQIFKKKLSPLSNLIKHELPLLCGLKSHMPKGRESGLFF